MDSIAFALEPDQPKKFSNRRNPMPDCDRPNRTKMCYRLLFCDGPTVSLGRRSSSSNEHYSNAITETYAEGGSDSILLTFCCQDSSTVYMPLCAVYVITFEHNRATLNRLLMVQREMFFYFYSTRKKFLYSLIVLLALRIDAALLEMYF